jgi:hypothetical protein
LRTGKTKRLNVTIHQWRACARSPNGKLVAVIDYPDEAYVVPLSGRDGSWIGRLRVDASVDGQDPPPVWTF